MATRSANAARQINAQAVLEEIKSHSSVLVQQTEGVSEQLIRIAILWHEQVRHLPTCISAGCGCPVHCRAEFCVVCVGSLMYNNCVGLPCSGMRLWRRHRGCTLESRMWRACCTPSCLCTPSSTRQCRTAPIKRPSLKRTSRWYASSLHHYCVSPSNVLLSWCASYTSTLHQYMYYVTGPEADDWSR